MMLIGSMIRIRERIAAAPSGGVVAAVVHVVLDGDPLFWVPAGQAAGRFVDDLRALRRSDSAAGRAMRASAVSVAFDARAVSAAAVDVRTDAGRLVRPLIVLRSGEAPERKFRRAMEQQKLLGRCPRRRVEELLGVIRNRASRPQMPQMDADGDDQGPTRVVGQVALNGAHLFAVPDARRFVDCLAAAASTTGDGTDAVGRALRAAEVACAFDEAHQALGTVTVTMSASCPWRAAVDSGAVDLVDAEEEAHLLVAATPEDADEEGYTHLEPLPAALLGAGASAVPFIGHNQGPR